MPRATKDNPSCPFDIPDAIRRAARCRATRERVGLNVDAFAHYVGVTVRSVNRWESWEGRGSCPDDVLARLDHLVDLQVDVIQKIVGLAGQWVENQTDVLPNDTRTDVRPRDSAGEEIDGSIPKIEIDGSMPYNEIADSMLYAINDVDDEIVVTLIYHPNQHTYDANRHDGGYHGVWNATARAVAQELEAYGYVVDWKYATA